MRNWETEKFNKLPQISQSVSGRSRIWAQGLWIQSLCCWHMLNMSDFFFCILKGYFVFFQLFSTKVMRNPFLVGEIGLLALKSAANEGQNQGQDSHMLLLETYSKLLEILTLRHRLIEMCLESVHLARSVEGLGIQMEDNRLWVSLPTSPAPSAPPQWPGWPF